MRNTFLTLVSRAKNFVKDKYGETYKQITLEVTEFKAMVDETMQPSVTAANQYWPTGLAMFISSWASALSTVLHLFTSQRVEKKMEDFLMKMVEEQSKMRATLQVQAQNTATVLTLIRNREEVEEISLPRAWNMMKGPILRVGRVGVDMRALVPKLDFDVKGGAHFVYGSIVSKVRVPPRDQVF